MSQRMTTHALSQRFLDVLASNLALPSWISPRQKALVWQHEEALYTLRLLTWATPDKNTPGAPPLLRISINYHTVQISQAACRRFGLSLPRAERLYCGHDQRCRLEWTVLPGELLDFGPWLGGWFRLKTEQAWTAPPPPHASYLWGCGLREIDYAWTVAAWQVAQRREDAVLLPFVTCMAPPEAVGVCMNGAESSPAIVGRHVPPR